MGEFLPGLLLNRLTLFRLLFLRNLLSLQLIEVPLIIVGLETRVQQRVERDCALGQLFVDLESLLHFVHLTFSSLVFGLHVLYVLNYGHSRQDFKRLDFHQFGRHSLLLDWVQLLFGYVLLQVRMQFQVPVLLLLELKFQILNHLGLILQLQVVLLQLNLQLRLALHLGL